MRRFISVKDVDQHHFVVAMGNFLKKTGKVTLPEWTDLVKLTRANEQGPMDPDWFFIRCASMLRHLYIRSTGLNGFSKIYSRKQRNGTKPAHFSKANRSVLRAVLKQMETLGLVEKHENGGRILTSQGRRDLDRIAYQVHAKKPAAVAAQ